MIPAPTPQEYAAHLGEVAAGINLSDREVFQRECWLIPNIIPLVTWRYYLVAAAPAGSVLILHRARVAWRWDIYPFAAGHPYYDMCRLRVMLWPGTAAPSPLPAAAPPTVLQMPNDPRQRIHTREVVFASQDFPVPAVITARSMAWDDEFVMYPEIGRQGDALWVGILSTAWAAFGNITQPMIEVAWSIGTPAV